MSDIALKDDIEREVMGVISRVSQPTDWVSGLAYSQKSSGRLRISLDPKDLNRAIKRPQYHTMTLEEITHTFSGATFFVRLNARHAYLWVSLDQESSIKYYDNLQRPFRSVPIPDTTIRLELEPGRVPGKDGPDPKAVPNHHQHRR